MAAEQPGIGFALEMLARTIESQNKVLHHRLDRFEDHVNARFDGQDAKLAEVCDFRMTEHSEFRQGIDALSDRMDANDNQAKGRSQVWGGFARASNYVLQHAWVLALVAGLGGGWVASTDIIPTILGATQPANLGAAEAMARPVRAVVLIPATGTLDPAALRGPLDEPEGWR